MSRVYIAHFSTSYIKVRFPCRNLRLHTCSKPTLRDFPTYPDLHFTQLWWDFPNDEGIFLPLDSFSYQLQLCALFSELVWVQQSAHVTESQSLISSHPPPSPLPPLIHWVKLTRHADWLNTHLRLQHQHHHTKQNVYQCCREKNTCPPFENKRETLLKHEGQQYTHYCRDGSNVHIRGCGGHHTSQVETVAMIVNVAVGCCCVLGM